MLESVHDKVLQALSDPNFFVGVAGILVAILIPIQAQRRRKLYVDVVCQLKLLDEALKEFDAEGEEPKSAKRSKDPKESQDESQAVLLVIDLKTPGGSIGGTDIDTERYRRFNSLESGGELQVGRLVRRS
jgi:hypothetical protein